MENLICVVHYPSESKYSTITPLNENTLRRITEAKLLREISGGSNLHAEQCASVPNDIQPGITGIHMTPCYKKFTLFISQARKKKISLPCQQTLKLHILRSNFIAREWRNAHINIFDIGKSCDYGWTNTNEPKWVEAVMPEDVEELFLSHDEENYQEDSDDSDCDE